MTYTYRSGGDTGANSALSCSLWCTDSDQFWTQKNRVCPTPPTQNVSKKHTNTIRDYFKIEPH